VSAIVLLILVTVLYAGYNVFVKAATDSALDTATSTILATIALQATALMVSFCFAAMLLFKGDAQLSPGNTSLAWAATAYLHLRALAPWRSHPYDEVTGAGPRPLFVGIPYTSTSGNAAALGLD